MNARSANKQHMHPQVIATGAKKVERSASPVVHRGELHGELLKEEVCALGESDLVAFMASDTASRIIKTVAVEFLTDVDKLVVLASRELPLFVRLGALRRLDGVLAGTSLTQVQARRLLPCLERHELIAYAIELMNGAGFDWCAVCTEHTTDVLCAALYNADGILEEVLVDDAFAQLAYARPDLRASLRSCSPEKVLPMSACAPNSPDVLYVDLDRVDNVA